MARSVANTKVQLTFQSQLRNTLDDGTVSALNVGGTVINQSFTDGYDEDQCNRAYAAIGEVITSGQTVDIDLYDFAGLDIGAGAGNDGLGQAMDIEEIVAILIRQTAGPGRLEINATDPSNKATCIPTMTVALGSALKAGGEFFRMEKDTDALDIEDGLAHMMRLGANGGAVTYSLYVLGRSSDTTTTS